MTGDDTQRVDFVGLRDWGGPMVVAICGAGFSLHAWARRPHSYEALYGVKYDEAVVILDGYENGERHGCGLLIGRRGAAPQKTKRRLTGELGKNLQRDRCCAQEGP